MVHTKDIYMLKTFMLLVLLVSNYAQADQLGLGVEFQDFIRDSYDEQFNKKSSPISREEVLTRAKEALNIEFEISPSNYSNQKVINRCSRGNSWLRPYRLYNKKNKITRSIPYKWGGYFNELIQFKKKLKRGFLLGDVCTCRDASRNYCVEPKSLGLDCSGFVSYTWKTNYHATSQMHKITRRISWNDLQPGDALNKPGNHIILFKSYSKDKNYIHAIESTVRCDGVCETTFRVYDLKREGFKPIRYNNIY